MPTAADRTRVSVDEIIQQIRGELVPIGRTFSYFSLVSLSDDDLKRYLTDPIATLPPAFVDGLPTTAIVLSPGLEKGSGRAGDMVSFDKPSDSRELMAARHVLPGRTYLFLSLRSDDLAEYHYHFFKTLSALWADRNPEGEAVIRYRQLLREELAGEVHGEADDPSWRLKQALVRRPGGFRRDSKAFKDYAHQSLIDMLTLFLHGICCDIDVDTGPRQMASRHLRKRIELLIDLYPPPEGFQVLPEAPRRR